MALFTPPPICGPPPATTTASSTTTAPMPWRGVSMAADQVDTLAIGDGPGHLGARNRQRRPRPPGTLPCRGWRWTVGDRLLRMERRQVDAAWLVEPLELAAVMAVLLGSQQRWRGKRRGNKELAAVGHGVRGSGRCDV